MKLYNTAVLHQWDAYTIQRNFQSSAELMELAAENCVLAIEEEEFFLEAFVFCGVGNNGGDGLCIARLLHEQERVVTVFVIGSMDKATDDFRLNMQRLVEADIHVVFLSDENPPKWDNYKFNHNDLIIDAIFGIGINRPVEGLHAQVIEFMNTLPGKIIAIDVPSGLQCDTLELQQGAIVEADRTLALQIPKRAMLIPENAGYVGDLEVLDIALDMSFEAEEHCEWNWFNANEARELLLPRPKFSHKNLFGHLLVIGGSKGKMGAPVLTSTAAFRAGTGLVTAHIPLRGYDMFQTSLVEAMCSTDIGQFNITDYELPAKCTALAVGPGLGQAPESALMLRKLLRECDLPMVFDADALNIIGQKELLDQLPARTILTPHIGEFDRLFGPHHTSAERIETARRMSVRYQIVIVLKGMHTLTACPNGELYFNASGNPGMATAGAGDVLTGIIAGLRAQGYEADVAARLGVYIHGLAGDMAAESIGSYGYLAGEISVFVPRVIEVLLS